MNERELERLAHDLGSRAAERLDVERVAAGVIARLRDDRGTAQSPERFHWRWPTMLRIAAAAALLAGAGLVARETLGRQDPETEAMFPALVELSATELLEISDSLSFDTPLHQSVGVGLQDLTEEQLRELLRRMED